MIILWECFDDIKVQWCLCHVISSKCVWLWPNGGNASYSSIRHLEFSSGITTLTVRNMEVANFCAVMDILVDQDAIKIEGQVIYLACYYKKVLNEMLDYHIYQFPTGSSLSVLRIPIRIWLYLWEGFKVVGYSHLGQLKQTVQANRHFQHVFLMQSLRTTIYAKFQVHTFTLRLIHNVLFERVAQGEKQIKNPFRPPL